MTDKIHEWIFETLKNVNEPMSARELSICYCVLHDIPFSITSLEQPLNNLYKQLKLSCDKNGYYIPKKVYLENNSQNLNDLMQRHFWRRVDAYTDVCIDHPFVKECRSMIVDMKAFNVVASAIGKDKNKHRAKRMATETMWEQLYNKYT